jgi:predicted RNA-binding Zn-ribbon protein involved in translation (DUF1610 family)
MGQSFWRTVMRFRVGIAQISTASLIVEAASTDEAREEARRRRDENGGWDGLTTTGFFPVEEELDVEEVDDNEPLTASAGGEEGEPCAVCGGPNDDGEGWNGRCGGCADATEEMVGTACPGCGTKLTDASMEGFRCPGCGAEIVPPGRAKEV